jgi:hypothetical protein
MIYEMLKDYDLSFKGHDAECRLGINSRRFRVCFGLLSYDVYTYNRVGDKRSNNHSNTLEVPYLPVDARKGRRHVSWRQR